MSGLPKYLRLLFMAIAGAVAFYAAAHLSREQRDAQNEVVQPAKPRLASASLAAAPAPAVASEAASAALRDPSLSLGDRARAIPKTTGALFPNLSWLPPAPPPPPPPPPPQPAGQGAADAQAVTTRSSSRRAAAPTRRRAAAVAGGRPAAITAMPPSTATPKLGP